MSGERCADTPGGGESAGIKARVVPHARGIAATMRIHFALPAGPHPTDVGPSGLTRRDRAQITRPVRVPHYGVGTTMVF